MVHSYGRFLHHHTEDFRSSRFPVPSPLLLPGHPLHSLCMASAFLSTAIADLTLGKPALFWLPQTASVRDALRALKLLADDVGEISVWECSCSPSGGDGFIADVEVHESQAFVTDIVAASSPSCLCVGKVCMQTIVCYLASHQSLCDLAKALQAPVKSLLSDEYPSSSVHHVDPETSLQEALQLIAAGVQNLIVPITQCAGKFSKGCHFEMPLRIKNLSSLSQRSHGGYSFCWLTHEDVLRFLLGSIGLFSPLPMMSIQDLGIIKTDLHMVRMDEDVAMALELIKDAFAEGSAVAVVEEAVDMPGAYSLVGDISSIALQGCNETVALALATLPAGAFVTYVQECRHPSEILLDLVRTRLHKKLGGNNSDGYANMQLLKEGEPCLLLQDCESWEDSSLDEEESGPDSPTGPHEFPRKWLSTHSRTSSRIGFPLKCRSGPIFCNPESSLVAVLLQALANREQHVWVIREDGTLMGIVSFLNILTAMGNHFNI